jgi:hypothetical protein
MTSKGRHLLNVLFDQASIRLGGNEKARQYESDYTPTPCKCRLESGLEPFKIWLIGHNADALLCASRIAPPDASGSRAIAATKSP